MPRPNIPLLLEPEHLEDLIAGAAEPTPSADVAIEKVKAIDLASRSFPSRMP